MNEQYKGMTVNERLYVSGLMEKFDRAVRKKDVYKVVSILNKVDITDDSSVKPILDQLGLLKED